MSATAGLNGGTRFPDTFLDEIRARMPLATLVGRYADLKREGHDFKCLCPYHEEKTPSFHIYTKDNKFKCFGCGRKGDAIDFIQRVGNVNFTDGVIRLAGEAGLDVPGVERQSTKRDNRPPTNGHDSANGKEHKQDDWHPMVPPPPDAPMPSERDLECDTLHDYVGQDDRLLFYVRRFEARNGNGKYFKPLTYGRLNGRLGWHTKHPAEPRPLYGLNRLTTMPGATVILCEGEKCADAAQEMLPGYACVSWEGGTGSALLADYSPIAKRNVIIWPDADASGSGQSAAAKIAKMLTRARVLDVSGLPNKFDAANLQESGEADPEAWVLNRLPPEFFNPWHDMRPPAFPSDVLPARMERTVLELARRDGVDPGAQAMALLATASGAAHKAARFFPYGDGSDWSVPPIIWIMLIADSGQKKTAVLENAIKQLREIDRKAWAAHSQRMRDWKALPKKEQAATPKPTEPNVLCLEDITVEKLQDILAASGRGSMLLKDELVGFLGFGRYGKEGAGAERGYYLQAYEGGSYHVGRVGRDSVYVEVNALTIYGGIQPDSLREFKGLDKDGMIQRMCIVRGKEAATAESGVTVSDKASIEDAIRLLAEMPHGLQYRPEGCGGDLIRETESLGIQLAAIKDLGPGFQGFCSKLHGTHARLALLLHLLTSPREALIPAATILRASRLLRGYLLPQALDFYSVVAGSPAERVRNIAGWILTKAPDHGFAARDLKQNVSSCRDLSTREMNDAVDPLVTGGWLIPEENPYVNRHWTIAPGLKEAFAERTESERKRRAEARELLDGIRSGCSRD